MDPYVDIHLTYISDLFHEPDDKGNQHWYTASTGYSVKEHQHESENYRYLNQIQDNEIRRLCVKGKSNASDIPKHA